MKIAILQLLLLLIGLKPWNEVRNQAPVPPNTYHCENGTVEFRSDAPLEMIEARSTKLKGVIDPANQSFAWAVDVLTFQGFNSSLQREHFNENYLESTRYPKVTFAGKIIEKIDFGQDGTYPVRAKGKLWVHGVEQERIIKGMLEIKNKKLHVTASFTVPLSDHNITIPKIVYQKIAQEIYVTIDAELTFTP